MALLEVEALSVTFGGLAALDDVSLACQAGTVTAVIGPNGAGKTTLLNVISGYVRPHAGRVRLDGEEISRLPAHVIARHGLRRTFQNGGVFGEMSVLENILVGADCGARSSIPGILFARASHRRVERAAVREALGMIERVGLAGLADVRTGNLSFGQQRLVEITRALISHPKMLLLDEPAVGLSAAELDRLGIALRELARSGIAVALVEHVIDLVMTVSDRVIVMDAGKILAQGTPEEIRADQSVLEAYLGSL